MKSQVQKLALLAALIFGLNAQAGILLEPYLGYHTGKFKSGNSSETVKGVTYGGRLGYQQLGFMGGIDYMSGKWTEDTDPKVDLTPSDLGIFFGYNFPVLLRVYGVYNFQTKMKAEVNSNSATFDGGDGIKLGVGYTGLPFVSINLEYLSQTFKKVGGNTMPNSITNEMYGVTVSLPFDI